MKSIRIRLSRDQRTRPPTGRPTQTAGKANADDSPRPALRSIYLVKFLLISISLVVTACGGNAESNTSGEGDPDTGSRITTDGGTLRVGMANQPPFAGLDTDGKPNGVCTDIAAHIAEERGWDIEYFTGGWDALIPGLEADRWDVGLCFTPTAERCESLLFSEPVEASTFSFAVPPGNPKGIEAVQDFVDDDSLQIGVLAGSDRVRMVVEDASVPDDQITLFETTRQELDALKAGRIDAALSGGEAFFELRESEGQFDITARAPEVPVESASFIFRSTDEQLRDAVNEELKEMQDSGEHQEILEKWGFDTEVPLSQTSAELCSNKS